jgi:hypothetical protein
MTIEEFFQSFISKFIIFLQRLIPEYILPNLQLIIQILILAFVAFIIGRTLKALTIKILKSLGLKRITTKTWAESVLKFTGYRGNIVELIADLVKWLVYIVFLSLIIETLGLPGIAGLFTQIAAFMPRFIGAIVIVVIGFIIADFFGKIFEEATRRFLQDDALSRLSGGMVKYSVAIIAIIMSLSLIGLDATSLTVMFSVILITMVSILIIGLKDIIPNYSAGLQVKNQFKVGQNIKVGSYSGTIQKIQPFGILLQGKEGLVTIPNSVLLKEPVKMLKK